MKLVTLFTVASILVASVQSFDELKDFIFKKYAMLKVGYKQSMRIAMAKTPSRECSKRSKLPIPNVADKLRKELR